MPAPLSSTTKTPRASSTAILIASASSPGSSPPEVSASWRRFSSASLALETSSRTNTSLSVYREFVTMSSSRRVSAWNA